MRIILVALIAFNLSACAVLDNFDRQVTGIVQKVATPDNFDNVTILYGLTLSAGNAYYDLCERKIINKKCWKAIEALQPYEDRAFNAYQDLADFVKNTPKEDNGALLILAKNALLQFKNMQIKYSIPGVK